MESRAKLLLVDDDTMLIKALEMYLARGGYEVHTAGNGLDGLKQLFSLRPDLVVLDVMMPQLDGWETCRRIREMSTVPIIMLTARGQESERVMGLKLGADDYVPKPFSLKELEARIEAVLRRAKATKPAEKRDASVLYVTTELRLLFFLAENAGRVLSHQQLLEKVWGPEYVDNVNYTKLFIWRLRQKIEADPENPRYILTERGIGYRMALSN